MVSRQPKLHWYAFSYKGSCIESGQKCTASTFTGYPERLVTLGRIEENKVNARVGGGAVLLAVSYLGRMTRDEFTQGSSLEKEAP